MNIFNSLWVKLSDKSSCLNNWRSVVNSNINNGAKKNLVDGGAKTEIIKKTINDTETYNLFFTNKNIRTMYIGKTPNIEVKFEKEVGTNKKNGKGKLFSR